MKNKKKIIVIVTIILTSLLLVLGILYYKGIIFKTSKNNKTEDTFRAYLCNSNYEHYDFYSSSGDTDNYRRCELSNIYLPNKYKEDAFLIYPYNDDYILINMYGKLRVYDLNKKQEVYTYEFSDYAITTNIENRIKFITDNGEKKSSKFIFEIVNYENFERKISYLLYDYETNEESLFDGVDFITDANICQTCISAYNNITIIKTNEYLYDLFNIDKLERISNINLFRLTRNYDGYYIGYSFDKFGSKYDHFYNVIYDKNANLVASTETNLKTNFYDTSIFYSGYENRIITLENNHENLSLIDYKGNYLVKDIFTISDIISKLKVLTGKEFYSFEDVSKAVEFDMYDDGNKYPVIIIGGTLVYKYNEKDSKYYTYPIYETIEEAIRQESNYKVKTFDKIENDTSIIYEETFNSHFEKEIVIDGNKIYLNSDGKLSNEKSEQHYNNDYEYNIDIKIYRFNNNYIVKRTFKIDGNLWPLYRVYDNNFNEIFVSYDELYKDGNVFLYSDQKYETYRNNSIVKQELYSYNTLNNTKERITEYITINNRM